MPSVANGRDASLLQLQYLTESLGLKRTYLPNDESFDEKRVTSAPIPIDLVGDIVKPILKTKAVAVDPVKQPDIEWHPRYDTYQARVARLANYIINLSPANVAEVKAALAFFKELDGENGPSEVWTKTFPLPTLGERLREVTHNIHLGTGFNVIRGLNPTDLSPLDNVLIYLGLTSYIAEIRGVQDYDGRMIVHIKDIEKDLPESTGRPSPYTNRAQPFHTDMCDILSMYILDVAINGGESLLASSATIYNDIAATRPDLIHLLVNDEWIHDNFNKTKPSWTNRPLLFNFKDHGPGFLYSRRPLTGAPFSPHVAGVPAMTEEQAEAIDTVHFTAVKHQLVVKLQLGDIEIFNNMALFHGRNGFTDHDRPEARTVVHDGSITKSKSLNGTRHMLRLWLRSADERLAWETPEALESNSFRIYGDSDARKVARWDVHRAPAINRILTRHFECS